MQQSYLDCRKTAGAAFRVLLLVSTIHICQAQTTRTVHSCADDLEDKIASIRPSVVRIVAGNSMGTGFLVSRNGLIVTALHVVGRPQVTPDQRIVAQYTKAIKVQFSDRSTAEAEPIEDPDPKAAAYDIALLKVARSGLKPLSIAKSIPREGSTVYMMGFPLPGDLPNVVTYTGTIASEYPLQVGSFRGTPLIRDMIQVQAPIAKGFSGGPLLDCATDGVIGVIDIKIGSINEQLARVAQQIQSARKSGSVLLMGINPNDTLLELINVLDRYLSAGSGAAVSIQHISGFIRDQMQASRAKPMN